jgi:hypothetical protein
MQASRDEKQANANEASDRYAQVVRQILLKAGHEPAWRHCICSRQALLCIESTFLQEGVQHA